MARLIEKNGKFYRMRRSKLVEIPKDWVGQTTHPQTINKRLSKKTHKLKNELKGNRWKRRRKFLDKKNVA